MRGEAGWHLVWSDEFDGPSLDLSSWTCEVGDGSPQNPGWGNAESARSERFQGKYYTSARRPACGEIDIMEMRGGNDGAVLGTIHWLDADGRQSLPSDSPGKAWTWTG
ncbi:MAG TPA: hypothetical protein VMV03_08870 [Spirochaetia bacterium]|nr:hypothetical protein [Spirochaetia bacterium]